MLNRRSLTARLLWREQEAVRELVGHGVLDRRDFPQARLGSIIPVAKTARGAPAGALEGLGCLERCVGPVECGRWELGGEDSRPPVGSRCCGAALLVRVYALQLARVVAQAHLRAAMQGCFTGLGPLQPATATDQGACWRPCSARQDAMTSLGGSGSVAAAAREAAVAAAVGGAQPLVSAAKASSQAGEAQEPGLAAPP